MSKNEIPRSRASCTTAIAANSSTAPNSSPRGAVPNPSRDTSSSVRPKRAYCMCTPLFRVRRLDLGAIVHQSLHALVRVTDQ